MAHVPDALLFARRSRALLPTLTALTALLGAPAWAQEGSQSRLEPASPQSASRWGLGIGFASQQQPYAGADRKNTVLPLLYYENRWLRFAGAGAEIKLLNYSLAPQQELSGGLRLKYDGSGYEASDSPRLSGMQERKGGFWGGAGVTWRNPVADVSAEWVADLSGHSKGNKLQLQAERRFGFGRVGLTPRVQAQWLDKKYVDYYYGVRADEARADRAAYRGESAMAVEAGVRVDYALAAQHSVFLDLSATALPSKIKDSPLVDRSSLSRVAIGYLYRF